MRVDLAGQYGILALLTYNDVEIGQMNHEFVHFADLAGLLHLLQSFLLLPLILSYLPLYLLSYFLFLLSRHMLISGPWACFPRSLFL